MNKPILSLFDTVEIKCFDVSGTINWYCYLDGCIHKIDDVQTWCEVISRVISDKLGSHVSLEQTHSFPRGNLTFTATVTIDLSDEIKLEKATFNLPSIKQVDHMPDPTKLASWLANVITIIKEVRAVTSQVDLSKSIHNEDD
jgi:hypothetical protein